MLILNLSLSLLGCSGPPASQEDTGTHSDTAQEPQTVLRFVQLNDLHANLTPHPDLVREEGGATRVETRGGAARIATVVSDLRAHPNTVVLNIGDTYHGGVEALFTEGEAIYDVVEALRVDIGVPGNWDFAFGPQVSWKRFRGEQGMPPLLAMQAQQVRTVGYEALAANTTIDAQNTGSLEGFIATQMSNSLQDLDGQPWLPPTTTRELGGVTVGFIGLTSDFVARMHPMLALGIEFTNGEAAYRDLVESHARQLRAEGAQVVVVLSELSVHKDHRLAQTIEPGLVDVFFSAHTHEVITDPLTTASGALVVEAGNDGWIGQLDLVVEGGEVIDSEWNLIPVDASVEEDPAVAALVETAREPFLGEVYIAIEDGFMPNPLAGQVLDRPIDSVIGQTDRLLHRRNALESDFNNMFTDMLLEYTRTHDHVEPADLALSPGFRYEIPLAPPGWDIGNGVVATGEITLEQAYRYFPAPYTLGIGRTTLGQMRGIEEGLLTQVFSADVWKQEGGWVDGFSGMRSTVDLAAADGQRVAELELLSGTSDPATEVLVAGCRRPLDENTTLCSYNGFTGVSDILDPDSGLPMTAVQLFEWGLGRGLPAVRSDITETSGEPMWPDSPFVQPLLGVE